MTDNDLKRGIKLRREIDALTNHRETLEMMKEMCSEGRNASSTKEFVLKVNDGQEKCDEAVHISAEAAYLAVSKDIADISREIERLNEEFAGL